MSLEQSLSKKLTLGPVGSQQDRAKSPSSTENSPKSSPSKSASKRLIKVPSTSASSRCRSPIRRQKTLAEGQSSGGSSKGADLGEYVPGTSGPPGVDHSPFDSNSSKGGGVANKLIGSWKSACGKKTKDLIRRWKTLPEDHPDFDHLHLTTGASSPPGPCTNLGMVSATNVSLSQPLHLPQNDPGSMANNSGSGNSGTNIISSSGLGKLKLLNKNKADSTENPSSTLFNQGKSGGGGSGSGFLNGTLQNEESSAQLNGNKSSTGWSVHVWATYVQRGNDDVTNNEEPKPGRDFLTEFQKVKLTHFFRHVLDMNHDDVISAEDFVALNQRIRHYIEWSSECIEFHILKEVHSGFLECFLNQPLDDSSGMYYCSTERETRQNVNIDEWLDVWGTLLTSVRTMEALPLWLQYFPKILFQVINKSGSGTISKEQLRAFYTMFLGIDFRVVNETLDSIYNAMTDGGRNKMTYSLFKLCFANFLLGKYPHGPGQYLFGICAPATLGCAFPIDYSALNTPKDDLEPYDPDKDKGQSNRRSVIV